MSTTWRIAYRPRMLAVGLHWSVEREPALVVRGRLRTVRTLVVNLLVPFAIITVGVGVVGEAV